ncbi:MAG: DUF2321 domain-containing protein [Thermoanaerobacterium sp.]|nr:DUF2321 domain-containing protein [Thermoanaerobacterium sp.]
MGYYYIGQVCLNGHPITGNYDAYPEFRKNFCPDCGQPTITECPHCKSKIQGSYFSPGVISTKPFIPSAFCYNCGKAYPWTEEKLKAAKELIAEDESLSIQDKEILNQSLPDIISETPRTQLAAARFKKIASKALTITSEGLKQILIEIVSETTKKMLWG